MVFFFKSHLRISRVAIRGPFRPPSTGSASTLPPLQNGRHSQYPSTLNPPNHPSILPFSISHNNLPSLSPNFLSSTRPPIPISIPPTDPINKTRDIDPTTHAQLAKTSLPPPCHPTRTLKDAMRHADLDVQQSFVPPTCQFGNYPSYLIHANSRRVSRATARLQPNSHTTRASLKV